MNQREMVMAELQRVPDSMLAEILDFVRSVIVRKDRGARDTAIASESSLAKDWLRPEEDETWGTL